MTNGEKLKEVFPSIELYEKSHDAIQINFNSAWWNAEYKEPSSSEKPNKSGIPTGSNDCISRQDVLSEIIRFSTEEGSSVECQQLYCDVNNMPPVTPQEPRWIPLSERLPKEGKEVLVSGYDTYNKKVIISRYQGEQYGFTCGLVSAWMPLPKPYEPQESENP